jgi:hypothetical protein
MHNENLHFNFNEVNLKLDIDVGVSCITDLQTKLDKNIYNIHVHSKLFYLIDNPKKLSKVIGDLNNGKCSVLYFNIFNFFYLNVRYVVARIYTLTIKPIFVNYDKKFNMK